MTTIIEHTTTVGHVARDHPAAVAVFEAMDIEYACHGGRSLRDAAVAAGVDPQELLDAVRDSANNSSPARHPAMGELIHSLAREHSWFARLGSLADRMNAIDSPNAARVRRLLLSAGATLSTHTLHEERELFPRIEELALHPDRVRPGSISRRLLLEFVEHDTLQQWFVKIRELVLRLRHEGADGALLDEIDTLDRVLHRHLHLENNVLIPAVIELEHELKASRIESAQAGH